MHIRARMSMSADGYVTTPAGWPVCGGGMQLTPTLSPQGALTFVRERALPGGSVELVYSCGDRRDPLPKRPASQRRS